MKTFTNYAAKAKQFLNLLQGYTKGIRITAILILLLTGVTDAWAWCGNSYITVNGTWYTASNSYVQPAGKFHNKNLGALTTLTLGGELQVYPNNKTAGSLYYKIDSGSEKSISLPYTGNDGNNSKHSGSGTVDLSGLAPGSHTIAVWFKHGSDYDSNNSANYKATFTIDPIVTFKANGGTGSNYTQKVTYNTSTALAANTFTRTGYNFAGWNTKTDGTGTSYTDKQKVTLTANTTLYAKWTEKTYSLTFKHNGNGTIKVGGTTVNSGGTASVNHVNTKTLVATPNTGYNFSGWTLSGSNTGAVTIGSTTTASTTIKATNTGATVTATFTPKTYAITLNANGGASNGSVTATYNSNSVTNVTYPTHDHYECTGYYTATSDGTLVLNTDGTLAKNVSGYTDANGNWIKDGTATLYAQWTPAEYDITYKDQGNVTFTGEHASGYPTKHTYGTETTLSTATKTGYTFGGWHTDAACTNKLTSLGATAYTDNITLYAKWTANTNTRYVVEHYKQNIDGTYPASATETENLTGTTDASVTPDVKLYTGFTAPATQTVTIKADGSLVVEYQYARNQHIVTWVVDDEETEDQYLFGATINKPTNPTKEGYNFEGWDPEVPATMPDEDKIFRATWTPNLYTITLDPQGGDGGTPSVTVHYETQDYSVNPVALPEKEEYNFGGYYVGTEGSGSQVVDKNGNWLASVQGYTDANGNWKRANNVTLYAHWIEKQYEQYTITYELNGGTNADNPTTYTIVTPDITLKAAGKMGYTFLGWYDNAEFNGTPITSIPTGSTGNKDLYAKWEERKLKIYAEWLPEPYYVGDMTRSDKTYAYSKSELSPGDHHFRFVEYDGTFAYDFEDLKRDGGLEIGQECPTCEFNDVKFNLDRESDITITLELQDPFDNTPPVVTIHAVEYYTISINSTTLKLKVNDAMPTITAQTPENGYAFMGYYTQANGEGTQFIDANGAWINVDGYIEEGKWIKKEDITLHPYFQQAQIATLTLDRTQIDAGDKGYVIPSYTIAPTPAGTVVVTWQLQYSNGNSVNGHEPIIEGETVKFSVDGLAAGAYKVVATLHLGDSNGEVLHTQEVGFVMVGAYTVTVKYMFESEEIAARTTHAGHPINPNSITAPEIGGYNFVQWVLGDGISSTSTLTDKTIEYLAAYDGYLTATYEKKKLIFLDLSKKFGTADWTAPHIYLYSAEFWDENKGTGATTNCVARGAMSPVPGTTGMWFYEYKDVKNFNGYVAFTPTDKMTQANFYDTEVIHRGDFSIGTPVFVPAVGQTANIKNPSEGKNAQYYNKGHWTKYMGGTGYTLKIYNHKEKEGREELMSVPFTGSSLYLPFTAVVDLEAGQTFGYKIVRDNDKWYKNDNDGTMTVNSHTNWPFVEDNSDGLACGIQTVAAGIHTFTLTLNATSGNFEVTVDYPVTVGDYRILYKDETRPTYKPSDIKKAEELNPVTSFFIRPNSDPELKIQTATYISDGDVSWSTYANEIHFKPNDLWKSDNARFAAYFYKGNTTRVWKDLTKNGDIYTCEKPSGCTHVIFCRMNPDVKTNSFDKGDGKPLWNQTRDLTLPTDKKNFYTLEEGAWRGQIYLKPNSNWTADGARFAAYFFEKSGENTTKQEWHSMFKEDDGTYWCDIPEGCSQVIFCRMNPNVQDNNWNTGDGQPFWGMQTNDLQIPTNSNDLYTITNGQQNKPTGAWSCKSWNEINTGSITDLTEELEKKLGEIKGNIKDAPDAVYTIYLSENGTSIEKVEPYTGNYYIRVDAADGKWYDYKTNPDNLMTYSAFSENEVAVVDGEATYKSPYSHYKTAWCKEGENVKFVIANDYSPCISDTLVQDSKFNNIDEHGNLKSDNGKYSANIRFMWNRKNNKVSRAYLAAATDQSREFLVLKSNSTLQDAEGNNIATKKVLFNDTQNWIYETTVKVQPGTHIKLYACYPTTAEADALYFRGEYASDNWDKANTSELLGGTKGDTWYTVRVIYDFKTNRLMTAWIPDNEDIEGNLAINADVMVTRSHHDDARCITFANEGSSLTEIKTVYGTLQFNRWILNNRANPQDLRVESCTKEDGNQRVFDEETTNEHHAPLPLAEQKSLYERGLYFVSFPFDVHLSDVFGFGTYGTHWVISAYNGKRRAERGYFIDNCVNDDCSNWDYIWDPDEFVMNANEGYLLSLDLDLMRYDNTNFWSNNRATVELYFPSTANVQTIKQVDYTMAGLSEDYRCNINLNVNRDNPIADRRIKDSYWRCIGVPSFADYDGANLKWTAFDDVPFIYEWNTIDNSLVPRDTKNFEFRATYAYLVQNGAEIAWSAVNAKPNQIIAKQPAEDANYDWKITIQYQDEVADHTYIRMTNNENVTNEFDFNHDLVKEFNYGRADIYTMIGYEPVAANNLPLETTTATTIPLGIDIEKAGEYTIAMPEGTTSVGVTLVDIETGQRTNLAAGMEYTVYLAKGKHNERFMIEISPVNNAPTNIDQINGGSMHHEGVQKYIIDGKLIIRTAEGEVFDAQGHRL